MRHQRNIRKFGRTPKHRKQLFLNLQTALMEHERIITTWHKAREMRPFIERLIHKAQDKESLMTRLIMQRDLKTVAARKNLLENIAPRFSALPGGYTKITPLGRRGIDKAKIAMIELIGNAQTEFEKNEVQVEREANGVKSFWEWEQGLLDEEELYWENQLRSLKQTIDFECQDQYELEGVEKDSERATEIRRDINQKHLQKKKFMMKRWQDCKDENEWKSKQRDYAKYEMLTQQYAYPINDYKYNREELK